MKQLHTQRRRRVHVRTGNLAILREVALSLLLSYLLCGASLLGRALPLAACFVAAVPMGMNALAATLGAMLGYFSCCEPAEAVEYTALVFLMLGTRVIFQGTGLCETRRFMPICATALCAILGSVRLLGTIEVTLSLWCSKCLLAGVCTAGFASALRTQGRARLLLAASVVCGLCGHNVELGLLSAVALSCAGSEILTPAVLGLALDVSGSFAPCATLALMLPTVICHALQLRSNAARAVSYAAFVAAALLFFRNLSLLRLLAVGAGAAAGFVLRRRMMLPRTLMPSAQDIADSRLEEAAQVLDMLRKELPSDRAAVCESEAERVFDAAAERVCRSCVRFGHCWHNCVEQTCAELSRASERIVERGLAEAKDFSDAFRESCCRLEDFISSINHELDGMLFRRRYYMERKESRRVISQEYRCVAQYLRAAGTQLAQTGELRFQPRVSICSAEKNKGEPNGDKGVCFSGPNSSYFILLCDGMGTGEAAARVSTHSVRLLERLLKRGLAPLAALKLLNGSMLLRENSEFSTVDLLQADLCTGKATLYKWGAAASFWKDRDILKILRAVPLPPGVGIGKEYRPEEHTFSLCQGELLVMLSDGACSEETESIIAAYRGSSPQELASLLAAQMKEEDDRTAIVVSLRARP